MSFQDALHRSPDRAKRHNLLGNGFSGAWRNDIFCYDALFNQANFNALSPAARDAFNALNTTDFETVIRALRQASRLATVYVADRHGKKSSAKIRIRTLLEPRHAARQ